MTMAPKHSAFTAARPAQLAAAFSWKRPLDILVALAAIIVLSPVFLITVALVGLTSKGGIFFRQTRVGKDGKRFGMLKFRSMYQDAEVRRAALLGQSDRDGTTFKMKNDPRITPFGRFIRRASIDELPQLFNVLKGDMSLVGPRPALPSEVAAYPVYALERLNALPGITGVWQISGRADVSFDQMIDMDLAYVRGATLTIDLMILWGTLGAVLTARGAY